MLPWEFVNVRRRGHGATDPLADEASWDGPDGGDPRYSRWGPVPLPWQRRAGTVATQMAGVLRLVVAEDNLLVREGLVSLLMAAGDLIPTTVCSTLDELYEAVERDEPDVVVTDIRMPPKPP
jgi:hypothetical protein